MSTHQTAKTQFVVNPAGERYAYRRLGTASGTPLLLLLQFRSVMDVWDPLFVNLLAAQRNIILFDYAGSGYSTGEVANSARASANHIIEFLGLIGEPEVDILGFSMGGLIAQLVALNADPKTLKIRKLILAGTGTSAGEGILPTPNTDVGDHGGAANLTVDDFKVLFFPKTKAGNAAAESYWARIHERSVVTSGEEPQRWISTGYVDGGKGLMAQVELLTKFATVETSQGEDGAYERLPQLKMPVLVANGKDDYMIPTSNSYAMFQRLPNAQLLLYPDSGHGFLFQYAHEFSQYVANFLAM